MSNDRQRAEDEKDEEPEEEDNDDEKPEDEDNNDEEPEDEDNDDEEPEKEKTAMKEPAVKEDEEPEEPEEDEDEEPEEVEDEEPEEVEDEEPEEDEDEEPEKTEEDENKEPEEDEDEEPEEDEDEEPEEVEDEEPEEVEDEEPEEDEEEEIEEEDIGDQKLGEILGEKEIKPPVVTQPPKPAVPAPPVTAAPQIQPESVLASESIEEAVEEPSEGEGSASEKAEQGAEEAGEGEMPAEEAPSGPYITVISLSKAGSVTIPKDIRESLKLDPGKKLKFTWDRENKLLFEIAPDNEIIEIEQAIEAEKEKKAKKTEKKAGKKGKVAGPEFDFGKYLGHEFEGSNKLQPVLEKSFDQFKLDPPNIEEGLKYVKFALLSLTGDNNIVNSKLRYTIGNYLCDVVEKFNLPMLLDFLYDNIIKDIKSKFLFEQGLVQLAVTSSRKRQEKVKAILEQILHNIDEYPAVEMYNVINSFELLSKRMAEAEFTPEFKEILRDKIIEKIPLMQDKDYKLQAIRQIAKLRYFDEAIQVAQDILDKLGEEESWGDELRELITEIQKQKETGLDFKVRRAAENKEAV